MFEDRRYAAKADEDGGGRDEKYGWTIIESTTLWLNNHG